MSDRLAGLKLIYFSLFILKNNYISPADDLICYYQPLDKTYLSAYAWDTFETEHNFQGTGYRAFVLAHEYGHRIQKLIGLDYKLSMINLNNLREGESTILRRRVEFLADAFAGYWVKHAYQQKIIDDKELDQIRQTVMAMGDPSSDPIKDHGKGEERLEWFEKGFLTDDPTSLNPIAEKLRWNYISPTLFQLIKSSKSLWPTALPQSATAQIDTTIVRDNL